MDNNLKIRVEADLAPLSEMRAALKAAKGDLDALAPSAQIGSEAANDFILLTDKIKEADASVKSLTKSNSSYHETVRQSRTEHRMFMFAIMEGMHAFDGLGDAIGRISGASEDNSKKIKAFTTDVTSAAQAGLGMKFALDAIGLSAGISGGLSIAVGLFTLIGSLLKTNTEELKKQNVEIEKQSFQLQLVTGSELIAKMEEARADAQRNFQTKQAEFQHLQAGEGTVGRAFDIWTLIFGVTKEDVNKAQQEFLKSEADFRAALKAIAASQSLPMYEDMLKLKETDNLLSVSDLEFLRDKAIALSKITSEQKEQVALQAQARKYDDEASALRLKLEYAPGEKEYLDSLTGSGFTGMGTQHRLNDMFSNRQIQGRDTGAMSPSGGMSMMAKLLMTDASKSAKSSLDDIKGLKEGLTPLAAGFDAVAKSISDGLVAQMGQATSVFQVFRNAFITGLVDMIAKMGEMVLMAGILSLVLPGAGVFGNALKYFSRSDFLGSLFGVIGGNAPASGAASTMGGMPSLAGQPIILINQLGNRSTDMVIYDSLGRMTAHRIL